MQSPNGESQPELFGLTSSYEHEGLGGVAVSSGAEIILSPFFEMEFPWNVSSEFLAEFKSSWNTGQGEFYWYRVEGECENLTCKVNDMRYDSCPRTMVTVVAARSLSELCYSLKNPLYNPPVKWRLASIARYSRPVGKDNIVDGECNILEQQEFCQVAECFDYCIDQDLILRGVLSFSAVEDIALKEMTGSLALSGTAQTNRRLEYTPDWFLVEFGGSFDANVSFGVVSSPGIRISGSSLSRRMSSELEISGSAQFASPIRNYSMSSALNMGGSAKYVSILPSSGGLVASGSAECPRLYSPEGRLQFNGNFSYRTLPTFFNFSSSLPPDEPVTVSDLGSVIDRQVFNTTAFDIGAEYPVLANVNTLTINTSTVTVSCGCGVLGQVLYITHNLSFSKVFSNFLKRNGLSFPYRSSMRYKSADKSWRCVERYSGFSLDGATKEDWILSFSLACANPTWIFTFSVRSSNQSIGKDLQTKFVLEIPVSLICADNNISTVIRTDINSFAPVSKGAQILVVNSDRATSVPPPSNKVDISVDGTFNDFVMYQDAIGLFGNSYWHDVPFEIRINPVNRMSMPQAEISQLFPSATIFPTP